MTGLPERQSNLLAWRQLTSLLSYHLFENTVPQDPLKYLSTWALRDTFDEAHFAIANLVMGQASEEMGFHIVLGERSMLAKDNVGTRDFRCELRLGYANDGGVDDLWMGKQAGFNFCWRHLPATYLDEFLHAIHNENAPVIVDVSNISSTKPALWSHDLLGGILVVAVFGHIDRPANPDLAFSVVSLGRLLSIAVSGHDACLIRANKTTNRSRVVFFRVVECGHPASFSHAPDLTDASIVRKHIESAALCVGTKRSSTTPDLAETLEWKAILWLHGEETYNHRRWHGSLGDSVVLDNREEFVLVEAMHDVGRDPEAKSADDGQRQGEAVEERSAEETPYLIVLWDAILNGKVFHDKTVMRACRHLGQTGGAGRRVETGSGGLREILVVESDPVSLVSVLGIVDEIFESRVPAILKHINVSIWTPMRQPEDLFTIECEDTLCRFLCDFDLFVA